MAEPGRAEEAEFLLAFALTAKRAQHYEALLHIIAILVWMTEQGIAVESPVDLPSLPPAVRGELDRVRTEIEDKTLGRILNRIRDRAQLSADGEEALRRGISSRNYLFHHFFRDNLIESETTAGRADLARILTLVRGQIDEAASYAKQVIMAYEEYVGVTNDGMRRALASSLAALAEKEREPF